MRSNSHELPVYAAMLEAQGQDNYAQGEDSEIQSAELKEESKGDMSPMSPIIPLGSKSTHQKIFERLYSNQDKFARKQDLFNMINIICLILTIYNLVSILNIEGQESLKMYDQTAIVKYKHWAQQGFTIYYLIVILILVHFMKVGCCIIGFFCVVQKSEKLLTIFMMLTFTCIISRGIITILLLINYKQIERVCERIFGNEADVASTMAIQFTVILMLFMIIEVVLGMYSLLLGGSAKKAYKQMRGDDKKMMTHYDVLRNLTLKRFTM